VVAQPQSAEERAAALMAAVALEGLSPEASIAAMQQLNYDLTMQVSSEALRHAAAVLCMRRLCLHTWCSF
jgi:hypothetical protein